MRRRLFDLAAAVSLALCMISLASYARSQFVSDRLTYDVRPRASQRRVTSRTYSITSQHGTVNLYRNRRSYHPGPTSQDRDEWHPWRYQRSSLPPLDVSRRVRAIAGRFSWSRDTLDDPTWWNEDLNISVPWWFVVLMTGALPSAWGARRARERRRRQMGLCPTCGYDLRATPGRCPECGAVPEPVSRTPHNPPMQRTATASSGAVE